MKITASNVNFSGPAGNIQGILDLPEGQLTSEDQIKTNASDFISVNCHPHSLHGGTMTNKVVYTVSRAIAGLGIPSLRFNFRGVSGSEGEYDEGQGEQADLKAAVAWMQAQYPQRKLILSGFSFGSYVSALASEALNPEILLTIAPPVKRFNFENFTHPASGWTVIMGEEDELVQYLTVKSWVESFEPAPTFITMKGASHFFHGQLVDLRKHVENCVSQQVLN